jgi:hypothetical protein
MAEGKSFEFTPHLGIVERRTDQLPGQALGDIGNAGAALAKARETVIVAAPIAPTVAATSKAPAEPTSRRQWLKELRARRAELIKEIKRLRSLEQERDEITRLIEAATTKPERKAGTVKLLRQQNS